MKVLSLIFILSLPMFLHAQRNFTRLFGTNGPTLSAAAHGFCPNESGGYLLAGEVNGVSSLYLVSTDSLGDLQWAMQYGGTLGGKAASILPAGDGNYLMCGRKSTASVGNNEFLILKINASGNILWQKIYYGTGDDVLTTLARTQDGHFIAGGFSYSFGGGDDHLIYLMKVDTVGNLLWAKVYDTAEDEEVTKVLATKDNGFIACGSTQSFYSTSMSDATLIKTDSAGNIQWAKAYGGKQRDLGTSVAETMDGGYIMAAVTTSFGAGNSDLLLIKVNTLGNIEWTHTYGGTNDEAQPYNAKYFDLVPTTDGYVVSGSTRSFGLSNYGQFVLKVDLSGKKQWFKILPGSFAYGSQNIQQTKDEGFAISSHSAVQSANKMGMLFIKIDKDGNRDCQSFEPELMVDTAKITPLDVPYQVRPVVPVIKPAGLTASIHSTLATSFCGSVLSVEETSKTGNYALWPNPCEDDYINIEFPLVNHKVVFLVYNAIGQNFPATTTITGKRVVVDLRNLPKGIYCIKATQEGEEKWLGRFLKSK